MQKLGENEGLSICKILLRPLYIILCVPFFITASASTLLPASFKSFEPQGPGGNTGSSAPVSGQAKSTRLSFE